MILSKTPSNCANKEEIRAHIDIIDKEIISLFAMRFQYVEEIVKFKSDAESVVALERKNEVITKRGEWASADGLDREVFEQIYKLLIEHNIQKELDILNNKSQVNLN